MVTGPMNHSRLKFKLRDLEQGLESDESMMASWKWENTQFQHCILHALATRFLGMPCFFAAPHPA